MPGKKKQSKNRGTSVHKQQMGTQKREVQARKGVPMHLVVPRSSMCTLVFTESLLLAEGATGVGTAKMLRVNAPYDVDPSLGSTSVAGFSEMAAFYQSYRVRRVSVIAQFAVYATGGLGSVGELSLFPTATSSVPSNAAAWMVQRQGVTKVVYPCVGAQTGGPVPMLRLDMDIPKFLALSQQQWLTDHQYTASTNTIPNKLVFVACCLRGGGSSTPASATLTVRLAMEVQFFDPVVLSN